MGWESSGVVGFDLGPLLQGLTRIAKLKSAYPDLCTVSLLVYLMVLKNISPGFGVWASLIFMSADLSVS